VAYSQQLDFPLLSKKPTGRGSYVLRFGVPEGAGDLAQLAVPSGVKLLLHGKEKSYSPVSLPREEGFVDVLVKPYAPDVANLGGFSAFLCDLEVGQTAPMYVKPPRVIHGHKDVIGKFDAVGLVGGGTGTLVRARSRVCACAHASARPWQAQGFSRS